MRRTLKRRCSNLSYLLAGDEDIALAVPFGRVLAGEDGSFSFIAGIDGESAVVKARISDGLEVSGEISARFSGEGKLFGSGSVMFADVSSDLYEQGEAGSDIPMIASGVLDFDVSEDGGVVVYTKSSGSTVSVFEVLNGKKLEEPVFIGRDIDVISLSPDGRTLLSVSKEKRAGEGRSPAKYIITELMY